MAAGRQQEAAGILRAKHTRLDTHPDSSKFGLQQGCGATLFAQTVYHQGGQLGQIQGLEHLEEVRVGRDDVLEKDNLGLKK